MGVNTTRFPTRSKSVQPSDYCYSLPFENESFDRVFSHALLEHLSSPILALRELSRVLNHGGVMGVCSPDWGGFLFAPPSQELSAAVDAYKILQSRNGGDVQVGRKLGVYLDKLGFEDICVSARYECYQSLNFIGDYLAEQLEREGDLRSANQFRTWSKMSGGMFAQAWVSATGRKR